MNGTRPPIPAMNSSEPGRSRRIHDPTLRIMRWPAYYLRQLCKAVDGNPALILLTENVDNDLGWMSTLAKIGLDGFASSSVAKNLRNLLHCDDSKEIAVLTMRLI